LSGYLDTEHLRKRGVHLPAQPGASVGNLQETAPIQAYCRIPYALFEGLFGFVVGISQNLPTRATPQDSTQSG